MTNLIASLVVIAIVAAAVVYIIREKKKGTKCIGCPAGCSCGRNCQGGASGCGGCPSQTEGR